LSEKQKIDLRNANVGIAVIAVILAAGFVPLHGSKSATEGLAVVAFVAGFAVFLILNRRDERAEKKAAGGSS
jgi:uncharacterized membrane protein